MSASDYRDAAVQFLLKPENLEVALEVAELVEDVKDELVLEFWHTLKGKVCENQGKLAPWLVKLDSDEQLKGNWSGLDCVPDVASRAQHYLRFHLEREGDKIRQGVCWNEERKTPFDKLSEGVPQLRQIRDRLDTMEGYSSKANTWWIGYKYLNNSQRLREKTSLLRIQAGMLVNEVADEFVEFAKGLQKLVEGANSALAKIDPASVK